VITFLMAASTCFGRISAREKAILDQYYAQLKNFTTNTIPGSYLVDGSLLIQKLDASLVTLITDGSNAWVWIQSNSNDVLSVVGTVQASEATWDAAAATVSAGAASWDQAATDASWSTNWIQTNSNSYWRITTTAPTGSVDTAQEHTLYASTNGLDVCVEADFFGPGTNWLRAPLSAF